MKSSIVESIKSLPPLSKTIIEIEEVYDNPESGIGELAKVIEQDPMIVANLLKAANSPLYGFGKELTNVSQAVSLFGMTMTRNIALGNAVRKLLNVDMQPYGITSDQFAEISAMQAALINKWYTKIDRKKAEKLYLAAFLQETGTILIANDVRKEDEEVSFQSEVEMSSNLAQVEKSYTGVTCSEVTATVFEHWGFADEFVEMIRYADNPSSAPSEVKEFATALSIVKTAIPLNKPLSEQSINFALRKAQDAGYNQTLLEECINEMLQKLEGE